MADSPSSGGDIAAKSTGSGVLGIKPGLLEWHSMTDEQRAEPWTGLVEWVARL